MNRRAACATSASAVVLGVLLAAGPAWAAPSTQVVQGDVLRLVSVADWDAASSLLPGQPVQWDVTVSAEAPDPGVVAVGVSASGDASLIVDAYRCELEWDETGCVGDVEELTTGWPIPRDGAEVALLEMADTEVAHLRLVISLAGDEAGSTQVRVHARGAGESAVIGPDGGLATTGLSPLAPWTIGAAIAVGAVGTLLFVAGRRRVFVEREDES
ncbi:hypothetical protein ASF87_01905 [Microbacterium sp. Leaf161]|uniref:hypothetical protein n=1 Tax=Microbacterium sp. Leaf161 TaxID=1736281 RepID=UPI0006FDADE3|nr:hypothetical protein [Microbacterium sp. Leaf161]KQR47742.1 hypothetical protein ASF87_01905 [Microbacterium sp. Leaf161]